VIAKDIARREPIRTIGAAVSGVVAALIVVINVFSLAVITPEQTAAIAAMLAALWVLLEAIRQVVWSPASVERELSRRSGAPVGRDPR
jgi:hypothetical protein